MLHVILPSTLTKENLASWLVDNNIEKKIHVESKELTTDDISEFEHKSSAASRAIDMLEELSKDIKETIKSGTEDPKSYTIPPTKGIKTLKENRKYADRCIKDGVSKQETELYGVVWPEEGKIIFFDIEGNEYPDHQRNMDPEESEKFDAPILKEISEEGKKKKVKKPTADFMPDGELDL